MTDTLSWLEEAIAFEATPKQIRTESMREFCRRHSLPESNYYYHVRKPENQARILELALNVAKASAPDVLRKLVEKAEAGDVRAIDIYLDYILKLAKNLDLKSDGKQIVFMPAEIAEKNGVNLQSDTNASAEHHRAGQA